jgi:hypothetical protein
MRFTILYVLATSMWLLGFLFKIQHYEGAMMMLLFATVLNITYIIVGLMEINKSIKLKPSQKTLWTVFFILMSTPTGLVYLFQRDRIQ